MTKNSKKFTDKDFQELASKINKAIIKNDGLVGDQRAQVEKVCELEKKFFNSISEYKKTIDVYVKFIFFIKNEKGNILSARPYFREKSGIFANHITTAIKNENATELMRFHGNYQLIQFIVDNWPGNLPTITSKYYNDFIYARKILIENNLPLAINRAKLFFRKTPASSLSLLDLIDICTYGLISGVDKYVGPYSKVWRSVCIGRMVGYMIEEYSKTFLRMYPKDRQILYRTNALRYRLKIEDIIELTAAVNESFEQDKKEGRSVPSLPVSEMHITTLLNGSSYIPAHSSNDSDDNEDDMGIYDYTPSLDESVESSVIKKDLMQRVVKQSKTLKLVERKVMKLKGVDI